MLTLKELQPLIIQWAKDKDLIKLNNAPKQRLKLIEEAGELANAILKNNIDEQKDAIGDIFVVLVILAAQTKCNMMFPEDYSESLEKQIIPRSDNPYEMLCNISSYVNYPDTELLSLVKLSSLLNHPITECANLAWNTIKNRTGKTVNGTFIKAE